MRRIKKGIDTGWEFDNSSKTVPQNQIMKSAIDIREKSIYFSTLLLGYGTQFHLEGGYEILPSWMWDSNIKYYLFNKNNNQDTKVYNNVKPDTNPPEGLDILYT